MMLLLEKRRLFSISTKESGSSLRVLTSLLEIAISRVRHT
jgi:hypothetical protein